MSVKIQLPVNPVSKPRMTRSDRWKTRPATTRYWEYKDALQSLYAGQVPPRFAITFYIPMPKSWSKSKRQTMYLKPHQQKPDVDNYLKAFLDSLCIDDSYVYDVRVRKLWAVFGSIELIIEDEYNIEIEKEL